MIVALALALVVTASGALATYIFDEGASIGARICTGACIGLAAFGVGGFVLAALGGLTALSIAVSPAIVASPLILVLDSDRRGQIVADFMVGAQAVRCAVGRPTIPVVVYVLY